MPRSADDSLALQARLNHPAPQLAPAVLSRIENHYHELSTTNLCGLVWAGAVLEELQPSVFEAANTLLSARPLQEFTARASNSTKSMKTFADQKPVLEASSAHVSAFALISNCACGKSGVLEQYHR